MLSFKMIYKFFIAFLVLSSAVIYPQYNGKSFAVGINAIYTTTAKLYLYPNSSDVVLRNTSFPLSDIYNSGIYFRYRLSDDILIGVNAEYMTKTASGKNLTVFSNNKTVTIQVQDGFKMIPFELSIYYLIPFSTERFKFLMGGGAAYYYGQQIRKFGNADINSSEANIAYGIQVSVSMDFLLTGDVIIHSGMKFRDPQFTVKNTYNRQTADYNGTTIDLAQDSFVSKINVDGVSFELGFAYSF